MKKIIYLVVIYVISFVTIVSAKTDDSWLIVPGKCVGKVTQSITEAELVKVYGRKNVKNQAYQTQEDSYPGVALFPNDSSKRISIRWKDPIHHQFIKEIQIPNNNSVYYTPETGDIAGFCRWKTKQGITLKTTLKTLEKLNGRPFTLAGFSWDDSGIITSWRGGKLEAVFGKNKGTLFLLPTWASQKKITEQQYGFVSSNDEFLSSDHIMQVLNPEIYKILLNF